MGNINVTISDELEEKVRGIFCRRKGDLANIVTKALEYYLVCGKTDKRDVVKGRELREMRKNAKLTQRQVAEKTGVTPSLISQIEKENVVPRLLTLEKILNALNQHTKIKKKKRFSLKS